MDKIIYYIKLRLSGCISLIQLQTIKFHKNNILEEYN